ncbi:MAG: hypothetical protein AB8E82_05125 [Aureispira sp.]
MSNPTNQSGAASPEYEPLIENKNFEDVKFKIPTLPTFPVFPSILSILSLVLLSGTAVYFYLQIKEQALWITLPFLFTVFGGAVGALLESYVLVTGSPFQMMRTPGTTKIQMIRFLNIAPVVATIFFYVCSFVGLDDSLRMAILLLVGFAAFALGTILYLGPPNAVVPLIILGIQLVQIIIIATSGLFNTSMCMVGVFLILQGVTQGTAFVIGTSTPLKSTGFHVLSTLSGALLFFALEEALKVDAALVAKLTINWADHVLLKWGLVVACLAGIVFAMRVAPKTYNVLRSKISNTIWSLQYFLLISAKRFPNPKNLTELYGNTDQGQGVGKGPEPSTLAPYYQNHPEFLPQALAIPSVTKLEGNVTAFGDLVKKAKNGFKIIALLDHFLPQANVNIPLKDKVRMNVWSDGSDIYPNIYTKTLFDLSLPVPKFKVTPPPVIDAYKKGQLFAYLAEFGVANPFLKKAADKPGHLVIDFRFLEKYDTKADYESYGGKAYFKVNSKTKRLELTSVVAPHTDEEVLPNPMNATFRHAESMVIASMYYQVISGKHLADIHMTYNLLEVVLHNAFDAQGQYAHPIRTFMYLHLFSHELAEELTTEHLVQEGAVFSQVFATTHDSLVQHLNDQYHRFTYAEDEDFEYREEIMTMEDGKLLPGACINWELEYAKVWRKYTDNIMNVVYNGSDQAVADDKYIQDMARGMKEVFLNGMPERYDDFKTVKGLSRWASDTIHHLVVRHQVYGTTGINSALDPRISSSQIPKDGGTPGVDEWRSLMGVALATACARFTLLYGKDDEKFVYLLDGLEPKYKEGMTPIFEQLHDDLKELDEKWTKSSADLEFNYNYFRAIPSDLRTGPGY